ncbi:hypothetical protein QBC40DRAFT_304040 [Triangularia verruculosa]|uniref:Uncharacterized protein n=1 Tax=Triangularia verruculosa TaxID=2587418 RepID=A0AAN6XNW5_9PEZI|nr:hypothetical protein QBC40DRAFT_304040 [Triangularia verruculosa]
MPGMTASAVEHRFRGVNAQAKGLRAAVELYEKGEGPHPTEYDFSSINSNVWGKGAPKPEDLQKYFGGSTEQGLQYHFRAIKQQANVLKTAVDKGEDPAQAFEQYITDNGHSVKTGVSVRGGHTKAAKAKAAAGNSTDSPKAGPSKKRAAGTPAPKTPHKSPTKKQKVKEESEIVSPPEPANLPEVLTSPSDFDPPSVDYDALDDNEAPKPKKDSPWKKMDIGGPGQWSNLMTGERQTLKAKQDEVLTRYNANRGPILIEDSSPDGAEDELPSGQETPGSPSPTPHTRRVKKEGGAHPPSTPAFKFDSIDIDDIVDVDEEMDDDDDDDDDHGAI